MEVMPKILRVIQKGYGLTQSLLLQMEIRIT
nr:MAG TPA: hypothetical protein [Caudoviricetes sp.]